MVSCTIILGLHAAGLGAGPALWLLVTTAISIKTGTWLGVSADTVVGLQASNSHSLIAGSSLLGSKGLNLSSSWKPLLTLISTVAVSPAGKGGGVFSLCIHSCCIAANCLLCFHVVIMLLQCLL